MQMVMIKHGAGAEMAKARPEKRPIPFFFQGEKLFTF
jgi:ABC-type thiamine transport system ATPase subunit